MVLALALIGFLPPSASLHQCGMSLVCTTITGSSCCSQDAKKLFRSRTSQRSKTVSTA